MGLMSTHAHPPGGRGSPVSASGPARGGLRYGRSDTVAAHALHDEVARAEADYQRLRHAWLRLGREEPDNEVGLAMLGADMRRAQARLQGLAHPQQEYGAEPAGRRAGEEKH